MLLTDMELDMEELTRNLNAFEKFLDTLPEKALGLGVRVYISFTGLQLFCFLSVPKLSALSVKLQKSLFSVRMLRQGLFSFLMG